VANGPTSGYLAELHGPEAVVPLPDGKTIPVRIEGGDAGGSKSKDMADMMNQFRLSMESMINQMNNRDLLNMMDEMVRAQKDSNDIQKKLLQAAAN
jgi:Mn-dependent DtxR family transcriptional regulator